MTPALIAIGVLLCWVIKQVVGTLLAQQVKGSIPEYAAAKAKAAALVLPSALADAYLEDWLAELNALEDKPLSALRFAHGLPRAACRIAVLAGAALPVSRLRLTAERFFDISVSALVLVYLAPLFGVAALALRLERKQPILHVSLRVGRGGAIIHVNRFYTRVCEGGRPARLTRVGALLERVDLDQLPKLINVLRGELALLGPPAMPVGAVDEITQGRLHALEVRPGMVSWEALAIAGVVTMTLEDARLRDRSRGLKSHAALFVACVASTGRAARLGRGA